MVPDICKRCLGDISAVDIEESARLHNSLMGDKTKPRPPQTASGDRVQPMGLESDGFSFLSGTLPEDAVIVGRARGF